MNKTLENYLAQKVKDTGITTVPGHWPDFKSEKKSMNTFLRQKCFLNMQKRKRRRNVK